MTVSIANMATTWMSNSNVYNAISMSVSTMGYGANANSMLLRFGVDGNTVFTLDTLGDIIANTVTVNTIIANNSANGITTGTLASNTITANTVTANTVNAAIYYDYNNPSFYLQPSNISMLNSINLLTTLTASSSANLAITNIFTTAFKRYKVVFENVVPATNAVGFYLRVYSGGAYQTTGYTTYTYTFNNGGSAGTGPTTYIDLSESTRVGNTLAWGGINGELTVYNPESAAYYTRFHGFVTFYDSAGVGYSDCVTISGSWNSTAAVTGFQAYFSTGNIASGDIKIYGVN